MSHSRSLHFLTEAGKHRTRLLHLRRPYPDNRTWCGKRLDRGLLPIWKDGADPETLCRNCERSQRRAARTGGPTA